jgi:hypothetical protein
MSETAAHLIDGVFPRVPVRQWVLSFPHALRYRLAYDAEMVTDVLGIFTKTVFASLIRRAREFGAVRKAQCGAVTFIQRFGSALNCNIHLHTLMLDGVYAADEDGHPQFQALPAPKDREIEQLAAALAERISKFLLRRGLGPDADPDEADTVSRDQPWLARLYAASVAGRVAFGPNAGLRVTRVGDQIDPESMQALSSPRCATVAGFSLHANTAVPASDRQRLERLAQYCARPPISVERLEPLPDGRLLYRFKRPWSDGTTHVILEPLELMEKLAAIVPAPRAHLVRYAGILAPAAKWRASVVPAGTGAESPHAHDLQPVPETAHCVTESASETVPSAEPAPTLVADPRHGPNYTWAELMKRVWALDILACPRCTGRMRIMAAIDHPDVTRKILDCVGLPSRAPPVAPAASNHHAESDWS